MNRLPVSKATPSLIHEKLEEYVISTYKINSERPFKDDMETVVFRNPTSKKWFAIMMRVSKNRLGINGDEKIYILNVKCNPLLVGTLIKEQGVYPAYHMNKKHWVSINISDCPEQNLKILVDESYHLTSKNK